MNDLISKARAEVELLEMAGDIELKMKSEGGSEYAYGFIDGYRAAARAIRVLIDERTIAIIAEMKAEREAAE